MQFLNTVSKTTRPRAFIIGIKHYLEQKMSYVIVLQFMLLWQLTLIYIRKSTPYAIEKTYHILSTK